METFKRRGDEETRIQADLIQFLEERGWLVKSTHGNMYQSGFPDLYCHHIKYRERWIEVKKPVGYAFTRAQLFEFPKFERAGCGIWILTAATEYQYLKLWSPPNWREFVGRSRAL